MAIENEEVKSFTLTEIARQQQEIVNQLKGTTEENQSFAKQAESLHLKDLASLNFGDSSHSHKK
jgi:hypothetical protein